MRPMLLLIICMLTLSNCQQSINADVEIEPKAIKAVPFEKKQKATKTQRDSLSPKRNVIRDRSRRKEEINSKFPFDIPLEDISKKVSASNELIPNNGKPTVVLFWLTTCYPCRLEMKAIASKYDLWQQQSDFNLVAISTDWDKNFEAFVKQVETNNWPWKSYRDVNREFRNILPGALNGLPQTFIFDKKGEIAYHSRKYRSGDEDKLFDKIKSLNKN